MRGNCTLINQDKNSYTCEIISSRDRMNLVSLIRAIKRSNTISFTIIYSAIFIFFCLYKIYKAQKGTIRQGKYSKSYIFILITSQLDNIFNSFVEYVKHRLIYK